LQGREFFAASRALPDAGEQRLVFGRATERQFDQVISCRVAVMHAIFLFF
jgi:hypothetical protein